LDPQFPLGSVGLRSGQINAYTDEFSLFIKGKSAHGASPHLSVDPVVAISFAIQALQTIVSRNIPPLEAAVVSIGEIKGGDDFAFFAQKVPATLIRLGCGKEGFTFPLHSSKFNFDEEVLQFGVALFSYLLVRLTSQNSGRRNNV